MRMLLLVVLVLALSQTILSIQPATVDLYNGHGLKFTIPDDGYDFVAVHYSINQPIVGVGAGQWGYDVHTKEGSSFVHINDLPNLHVHKGDTVYYWLHGQKAGQPDELLGLSAVIGDMTTTTSRPTTTTVRPVVTSTTTAAPPSGGNNHNTGHSGGGGILTQTMIETHGGSSGGLSNGGSFGGSSGGVQQGYAQPGVSQQACTSYPCLMFEDNFDFLNFETWTHELTASGGGNWEFEYYTNNRSNSYTKDGKLFIKPTLTADHFGEHYLSSGVLDLWGSEPHSQCTSNQFFGCQRQGTPEHIINPIQSARLRSDKAFNFKYGKMEVRAKMPKGDWIWPAIWLLPHRNAYGEWPASGEIDIVESRGNTNYHDEKGNSQGVDSFGSTLHFGPAYGFDPFEKAHGEMTLSSGTLNDDFHTWTLEWDENHIKVSFDGTEVMNASPPPEGFWKLGELDKSHIDNPYRYANNKMAPFDQEFFIIMNVAVGGVGFFPDKNRNSPYPKPWTDKSEFTARDFWNHKSQWYPTWNPDQNDGEQAAMQVDYIRVWKMKP
ncbi:beta-1,3-glucan-binding protein-like isoform X2 [Ostrea edulis]|uniref:beta-1,3-glucan-binding protein-like isoform X2 n=1 Tax=Ostrea edulis TaxID=37623 RepID=UPI0024AF0BFC|nr:beta-1,3-glucan-binding protein-like isoform X2 [Ostrea edulis]